MLEKLDEIFQRLTGVKELEVRVDDLTKRQDRLADLVLKHEREIGQLQVLVGERLPGLKS